MDSETKDRLGARLRRVEGQVAAIRRMAEGDSHCVDVLLQISAVRGALSKVGEILLASHIETCVQEAFTRGDEAARRAKVDELMTVFGRYAGVGRQ